MTVGLHEIDITEIMGVMSCRETFRVPAELVRFIYGLRAHVAHQSPRGPKLTEHVGGPGARRPDTALGQTAGTPQRTMRVPAERMGYVDGLKAATSIIDTARPETFPADAIPVITS
jgi:hypothetical protein